MLRYWRGVRSLSQLDLAIAAGVSTRHLSFIESGRAQPSRQMLLMLAESLDVPLRERNALLHAGGFAEPYAATPLDAPELASVERALRFLLERTEPYPCIVVDRHWNVLLANEAATRMLAWLVEPEQLLAMQPLNAARFLFSEAVRPFLVNWEEVASSFIQRLHREALSGDATTKSLVKGLLATPGVPHDWRARTPDLEHASSPFVPVVLERGPLRLSLFTTITTLGTPLDVTLQEMRIETYFPADEATAQALTRMAQRPG